MKTRTELKNEMIESFEEIRKTETLNAEIDCDFGTTKIRTKTLERINTLPADSFFSVMKNLELRK